MIREWLDRWIRPSTTPSVVKIGMNDRINDYIKHITAAHSRLYQAAKCVADEDEVRLRVEKCSEALDSFSEALNSGLMKEPWERGE